MCVDRFREFFFCIFSPANNVGPVPVTDAFSNGQTVNGQPEETTGKTVRVRRQELYGNTVSVQVYNRGGDD